MGSRGSGLLTADVRAIGAPAGIHLTFRWSQAKFAFRIITASKAQGGGSYEASAAVYSVSIIYFSFYAWLWHNRALPES